MAALFFFAGMRDAKGLNAANGPLFVMLPGMNTEDLK